jgi:aryl-alcohol dehydrogenase-like predicted oxidoreductase
MRKIALTTGGPEVSGLGLGCNNFGVNPYGGVAPYEQCKQVVDAALDSGYTYFDTAENYGKGQSEDILGRALGKRRSGVLIATKFGCRADMPGAPTDRKGSAEYIQWAIAGSLKRLKTDYIDVYQMHQPDPGTPIDETLQVLEELRAAGKIRYFGVDNCSSEQLQKTVEVARSGGFPRPISCMTYYSLLTRGREADLIGTCIQLDVRVHPWFVLESGLLTGKFSREARSTGSSRANVFAGSVRDEVWDAMERLQEFADAHGISLIELAIGGIAAMPGVGVVVVGASSGEQVAANAQAFEWTPTAAELEELRKQPWVTPNENMGRGGANWREGWVAR